MKSPKSDTDLTTVRPAGTVLGIVRPLGAAIKNTLITLPVVNKLVPGGRKPVTHLYPYQKVDLPQAFRGQHSIDWYKCIGCQQCVDVCPMDCLYMEEIGYKDLSGFYHINKPGTVKLLEEQTEEALAK